MDELTRIREIYERRAGSENRQKYSLFRQGQLYMVQRREQVSLELLRAAGYQSVAGLAILEIGCGRGERLADFIRWGARAGDLFGIEVMPRLVAEARESYPGLHLCVASGAALPFASGSFDIVVQSTVFTSILDAQIRQKVASEMIRVCRVNGALLWYDFRYPNPWNRDVRPIPRAELVSLFPGIRFEIRTLNLLPPIARRLAPLSFTLCRALETFAPLRSHYLALGRKSAQAK